MDRIHWRQNRITVYGKTYDEPRLTAWFGPAYRYSSIDWPASQIPVELKQLNKLISKELGCRDFDAVLSCKDAGNKDKRTTAM